MSTEETTESESAMEIALTEGRLPDDYIESLAQNLNQAEKQTETEDEEGTEAEAEAQEAADPGDGEPAGEATSEEPPAEDEPPTSKLLEVARIERQAREAKDKAEKWLADEKQRLESEYAERLKAVTTDLVRDPAYVLKNAGYTQEQLQEVAEALLTEVLGDDAPEEYKRAAQYRELRRENNERDERLRKERDEAMRNLEAQRKYAEYVGGLSGYARSVNQESFPLVAAEMKADSEGFAERLVNAASFMATQGQYVPTFEEVVAAAESELNAYYEKRGITPPTARAQSPEGKASAPKSKSITNKLNKTATAEPEDESDPDYYVKKALRAWQG